MVADILTLLNTIGVMALLGVLYGASLRRCMASWLTSGVLGVAFGLGILAAISQPITLGASVILGSHLLLAGFAGAFLPPLGALVAFCLAASGWLALNAVSGLVEVFALATAGAMGMVWAALMEARNRAHAGVPCFVALGVLVSWSLVSAVFLPHAQAWALVVQSGPWFAGFNILGALVFGSFIERERRNAAREQSLAEAANTDPLTGLLNRRGFEAANAAMRARRGPARAALRPNPGTGVVLIDLDHFKRINDTHGHDTGDQVLRAFGEVLRRSVRAGDVVGRLGGEEFGVLLPDTDRADAHALCERIRREVERLNFVLDGRRLTVTASFGLHWVPQQRLGDLNEWLRLADEALYRAKQRGRNRIEASGPPSLRVA